MADQQRFYPIGSPDEPWGDAERIEWFAAQSVQRSYHDVTARIDELATRFEVIEYGSLSIDPERYPLRALRIPAASPTAPWALITGGVHGYETSGIHGSLAFVETAVASYRDRLNLIVAPCVSPWGYEVINRWNPNCVDPNRAFYADSPSEEAAALMHFIDGLGLDFLVHMDLHETTDSDETEFRPAAAARDGAPFTPGHIPDGFYTVGDVENPQPEFQAAVIRGVEEVTHIAEADNTGEIIGSAVSQRGVIDYPNTELGLCAGMTGARFTTTTEVYPDSPRATPDICTAAQIAAVRAGLDFALTAD
jgi:hypothetical protein